ncbi:MULTISPECIES: RNA 3'-terminal phosphate cyclase [unclassified Acinetobacter]|uniref:RNA 3'-terminal phosphate cyclase n=1 Tax=unclassified Acinetobacter TaxID=196816 RepID=UPI00244ABFD6|nr:MULTISPECIES: RNA 3'-terminal phosphate cyclase [unclassified Acinetobacter]MDH0031937.1 RNA 3'-terminal phosphate cyclase [Acinetobacter sp. GD04021]MDH0887346.1 RNA 3'-terminal phosphate cyclase [Acinetobacter sp. GD03873]MDH1083941.1 RNA 3'-terminal phosphate cyclase [Acinetobacter sp. GD03983]MDH2190662.1 RNA 3'-terminal phosphate cyclase [Acinetobacter sp. GD03645]MDH2202152.1 RNA 3'-terminal phosphate cyclase [Acinetobacter sp. GD03647]
MNKALANMPATIQIDGSQGEGGGQILRTALALSMITGQAFELINIRAGRKKPGLMRQHLVCVQASQQISQAYVEGAELHSQRLYFAPQHVQSGKYQFQIGSAGSTTLVLQTLLPALLLQNETSELIISGGTHNPLAPTADFIEHCFLPCLKNIGIDVDFKLEKAGFFPVGAGEIRVRIQPWQHRDKLNLLDRGNLQSTEAFAATLNLAEEAQIAQRELATLNKRLKLDTQQEFHLNGISQGNTVYVKVKHEHHVQLFTALGEMRKSAEQVASQLGQNVQHYLASQAVVDEYLADQLLLPLALGQGGTFTAQCISEHTLTQATMIEKFIDCEIEFIELDKSQFQVNVKV